MNMGRLIYSRSDEQGHIRWSKEFLEMPDDIIKLDILQDIMHDAENAYDNLMEKVFGKNAVVAEVMGHGATD